MNVASVLLFFLSSLSIIAAFESHESRSEARTRVRQLKAKSKSKSSKGTNIAKIGKGKGGSPKLIKSSKGKGKGGKSTSASCEDFQVTADALMTESGFQMTGVLGLPDFIPAQGIGMTTWTGDEVIDADTSISHVIGTLMFVSDDLSSEAPVIFEGKLDIVESTTTTNVDIFGNFVLSGYFLPSGGIVTGQIVFDFTDNSSTDDFVIEGNATLCSADASIFS